MVPAAYSSFLVASTQASAALIGLLFVAISLAPERVFGAAADSTRKAMALSSFTALANIFFVSFGSLIPDLSFGVMVIVAGAVAGSQTLSLLSLLGSWRREGALVRGVALLAISLGIYLYEIVIGIQLLSSPTEKGLYTAIESLMLGIFAVGLARAWELLGAPQARGAIGIISGWLERKAGDKPDARRESAPEKKTGESP